MRVIHSKHGLNLILDTEDDATPAIVERREGRDTHTATYDCAVGSGELNFGEYELNPIQLEWLGSMSDAVDTAINAARQGMPEYD
jgi:hypothetical protein